mgnify:CR=1 FL=1
MLAAAQDYEIGGMQLPCVVEMAANSFFAKAGIGIGGGGMLTSGNANLLMAHGTPLQQEVFAKNEFAGRFSGTMCLSEPQAGSSLSDIATRATPDGADFASDPLGPRYRLRGNKMWISNGEHELAENIVHLVLAKIPDADGKLVPGTRGISLFIVPKKLVDAEGELTGERNDVALAGLNHKLGYRGIPNTLLNFGEGKFAGARRGAGAIGYLVGQPGRGPALHVPHDERGAHRRRPRRDDARLRRLRGLARLRAERGRRAGRSAPAARTRRSRRCRSSSTPTSSACCWRRRATAKARWRSSCTAPAWSTSCTPATTPRGDAPRLLLEVLTPIAKSWPSEWCLEANSLAIQVLGGYGYTRDFPVEQYWRDNRLNMIHEGTHGIQALDLLGRKVVMDGGAGLALLRETIDATIARAPRRRRWPSTPKRSPARPIGSRRRHAPPGRPASPDEALANATPYLQAFGHVVLAWIWLDVALCAAALDRATRRSAAGSPRAATSSTTSCRRSAPGSASSSARRHLPDDGRGVVLSALGQRVGMLIWVLIYGGLLALGAGRGAVARRRVDSAWSVSIGGACVAAVAGAAC